MSTHKPGTVAVATVNGRPNIRVFRTGCPSNMGWEFNHVDGQGHGWASDRSCAVTDVRPLVVLDLDYIRFESFGLPKVLEVLGCDYRTRPIAKQIEAQSKTRIPEPFTIGAVVRAAQVGEIDGSERVWTKFRKDGWIDTLDHIREWADLVDPVLVRDGIEDGA